MVIVLDRHEAKRLQNAVVQLPRRSENFGHTVYRASLRLEGNFNEVARAQRLRRRNRPPVTKWFEFGFRTAAIFKTNRSQD